MEHLTLLLIGKKLPPSRHLHKLSNKFINLFLKEREKESFIESDYYVVFIEERYFGNEQRKFISPPPAIPVHKDFLHQVQSIFGNLNAEMVLCTMQHEHPTAFINNIEYEGYCYYAKDSNEKILFFYTDQEHLTKTFIKMPQETNASKTMRRWLLSNI